MSEVTSAVREPAESVREYAFSVTVKLTILSIGAQNISVRRSSPP